MLENSAGRVIEPGDGEKATVLNPPLSKAIASVSMRRVFKTFPQRDVIIPT